MMDETIETNSDPTDPLDRLLASAGLDLFPEEVQVEVEALLSTGQSLEPEARSRFVKAAQRAGRSVALRQSGALEPLLFDERRARNFSIDDLAALTHLDGEILSSIERGERRIDSTGPDTIATWIVALDIDRETTRSTLRRSLGTPTGAIAYTSERDLNVASDAEEFVRKVLAEFDRRSGTIGAE